MKRRSSLDSHRTLLLTALGLSAALTGGMIAPAAFAESPTKAPVPVVSSGHLTNLAHLNWLLDTVPLLPGVPGHSTYQQSDEPTARAPWVYADRQADGSFVHVGGGGISDAAKGYYNQGAFDADDISRSAVVYLRDWKQNGTPSSKTTAYELLRDLTYLQTDSGPNAGNVVLWQQSDGTLNPSAKPVEQPDPSDSAESFWLARTVWALGEGYADFKASDPAFASFLQQRLHLALDSLNKQSLAKYGTFVTANGAKVPAWLIVGSASASGEAVLGLNAYVSAEPRDSLARTALTELAEGLADMASGDVTHWPYGAILPEANSQTFWHAWGGLAPAALSDAATTLGRGDLQKAAIADAAQFTAQLLTTGGPDNGWTPTPADTSQIAYGVDSRLESLLAVGDNTGARGFDQLAAVDAGWYFGANPAGVAAYDPKTGVCIDGISPSGSVNRNCGAESSIHTELSMLALDAHPAVAAQAVALTSKTVVDGITVAEAENGVLTGSAQVATPPSVWTGSANWSNGEFVQAGDGSTVTITLPAGAGAGAHNIYPIVNRGPGDAGTTAWTAASPSGPVALGTTPNGGAGAQGIAPTPTVLHPLTLAVSAPAGTTSVTATVHGDAQIDALLVQPVVSHLGLSGPAGGYDLYVSAATTTMSQAASVTRAASVSSYDASGRLVRRSVLTPSQHAVAVLPGGFTVVESVPMAQLQR